MKNSQNKVLVIGAGAWGSGLSNLLGNNGCEVFLSVNNANLATEINQKNTNAKYLPDVVLSKNIKALEGFVNDVDFVFVVVPSVAAREVFTKIAAQKFKENSVFVICSKGIEASSLKLLSDVFEEVVGSKNYAVLSGPNFAAEVASGVPSVTTVASASREVADKVIAILDNENFKAQYSNNVRVAEICGVVKNIIAIACGMVDGLGLGVNTKAAVVLKGVKEIQEICQALGAGTDLVSAAGFGDIFLTCSSAKSRNNSLGKIIAGGRQRDANTTYEGAVAAGLISELAKKLKLRLDLCESVNKILSNNLSHDEIKKEIIAAIIK